MTTLYGRGIEADLRRRLLEPRRFLQVLAGPRQVGKTTLAHQVTRELPYGVLYATADEPTLKGSGWIETQWTRARGLASESNERGGALLVLDEIQKLPGWSESVKRLWDEDTLSKTPLRVLLLGSAPLLLQSGLTESLAGRFELLRVTHWQFAEMRDAFGFSLDDYLYFGGYPGSASLIDDRERWASYIRDSPIETTISRDILFLHRVDKPALLRQLFHLACLYSSQILSYNKMLGQLQDAGNTTTLAHYLELLSDAGMVTGLLKFAARSVRQRNSSPKLVVLNTALMSALSTLDLASTRAQPDLWGRLVESSIGAHLVNGAAGTSIEVRYWRENGSEVDFVLRQGERTVAIEVKSGQTSPRTAGLRAFTAAFAPHRALIVGKDGIPIEDFLLRPVSEWMSA